MLTQQVLDQLPQAIIALYTEYENIVLNDIARRLAGMQFTALTPTAEWQARRLQESGKIYEDALKELARITGQSEQVLEDIFTKAGISSIKFDDEIYTAAGFKVPLNLSPAASNILKVGINATGGTMRNLTGTTALDAQQKFIKASDLAFMQVAHGTASHQEAVRRAIKAVAAQGIETVDYQSGRRDQIDVALRRNIITGINRTSGMLQEQRADEMGADLVAVSAHPGARNKGTGWRNHASWQGKIYSRSGKNKKYPPFSLTGYGKVDGLCGVNCRHSWYVFFEGLSENAYTKHELHDYSKKVDFNGQKVDLYALTQYQRELERGIRRYKREASALAAAGLDNSAELAKVRELQGRIRAIVKQTNLQRQPDRERV